MLDQSLLSSGLLVLIYLKDLEKVWSQEEIVLVVHVLRKIQNTLGEI